MNATPLKPWFQVDDDAPEPARDLAFDAAPDEPSDLDEPRGLLDRLAGSAFIRALARGRMSTGWALVPVTVAVILLMGREALFPRPDGLGPWQALGISLLMIASAAILVLARVVRRGAVMALIGSGGGHGELAAGAISAIPVEPELRPVWRSLESHIAALQRRAQELTGDHERMMLEMTLADAQRKRALTIVNAIPDPVLVTNAFDQIVQANPAAEELFGFKFDERRRPPIDTIIKDERLVNVVRQAREADRRVADRRSEHEIGNCVYAASLVPLGESGAPTAGESNHGIVVILRDITREKDVSRKKSEFVAQVSHELRTPLSSIRAYVEMLVDGEAADEETRKEYYDIIQTSAERLGRLIDNMLNISRIEAGTVRINLEPMAVSVVVKEACDMIRPAAEQKRITFNEHLTPVIYRVSADRDLLYQAVLNLVSNAVKYTPEGGQVTVRMTPREEQRSMLIEVIDTGAGIPREDLPRMFEKFFRVEKNKGMAKGTGLGLNLVKQIVEQVHGGQVSLQSEVGRGSTFGIVLPLLT